jgi:hypothetical protein
MKKFILFFLISLSVFASPREEAQTILSKIETVTSTDLRMEMSSQNFIGLPYGDGGPLGEGENARYDQDPLYRFDTFDCTTFVETTVSLALSRDVDEFEKKMDEIRYEDSQVDYLKRNHFPSLQWIPNNIKNGILKEINHLILPTSETKTAEAIINLPGWLKKIRITEIKVPSASQTERESLLEELRSYASQYSPVVARLNYLPISTLVAKPQVLKLIPNGAIVSFVRPNWDLTDAIGTHMNVSHQGLIFQKKNVTYLRHASSSSEKRVMEVPLYDYLKKFENHPTLKGIHLMQVNEI